MGLMSHARETKETVSASGGRVTWAVRQSAPRRPGHCSGSREVGTLPDDAMVAFRSRLSAQVRS